MNFAGRSEVVDREKIIAQLVIIVSNVDWIFSPLFFGFNSLHHTPLLVIGYPFS